MVLIIMVFLQMFMIIAGILSQIYFNPKEFISFQIQLDYYVAFACIIIYQLILVSYILINKKRFEESKKKMGQKFDNFV